VSHHTWAHNLQCHHPRPILSSTMQSCHFCHDSCYRQDYVHSYISYIFDNSVKVMFDAFNDGFHKVCGGKVLDFFQPSELQAMVVGNEEYDWDTLEKVRGLPSSIELPFLWGCRCRVYQWLNPGNLEMNRLNRPISALLSTAVPTCKYEITFYSKPMRVLYRQTIYEMRIHLNFLELSSLTLWLQKWW